MTTPKHRIQTEPLQGQEMSLLLRRIDELNRKIETLSLLGGNLGVSATSTPVTVGASSAIKFRAQTEPTLGQELNAAHRSLDEIERKIVDISLLGGGLGGQLVSCGLGLDDDLQEVVLPNGETGVYGYPVTVNSMIAQTVTFTITVLTSSNACIGTPTIIPSTLKFTGPSNPQQINISFPLSNCLIGATVTFLLTAKTSTGCVVSWKGILTIGATIIIAGNLALDESIYGGSGAPGLPNFSYVRQTGGNPCYTSDDTEPLEWAGNLGPLTCYGIYLLTSIGNNYCATGFPWNFYPEIFSFIVYNLTGYSGNVVVSGTVSASGPVSNTFTNPEGQTFPFGIFYAYPFGEAANMYYMEKWYHAPMQNALFAGNSWGPPLYVNAPCGTKQIPISTNIFVQVVFTGTDSQGKKFTRKAAASITADLTYVLSSAAPGG